MNFNLILDFYNLGELKEYKRVSGNIHDTYLVANRNNNKFIVQKINSEVLGYFEADKPEDVLNHWAENSLKIGQVLNQINIKAASCLKNKDNKFFLKLDNKYWRVQNYIENDGKILANVDALEDAGFILGSFHRLLKDSNIKPKYSIPNFFNTAYYIGRMKKVFEGHEKNEEYKFLIGNILNDNIPKDFAYLLHADPKLDNFLFKGNKVVGVIDLDTIMSGNRYLDIGDALRNWCKTYFVFQRDFFFKAVKGYGDGFGKELDPRFALASSRHITLQLAIRFLTDSIEEKLFNWDKNKFKSASESNLLKARNCIKYYETIKL